MSDRSTFWPSPPDWAIARIDAPGLSITAGHADQSVWLLSGPAVAVAGLVKAAGAGEATVLSVAPDRVFLIAGQGHGLNEGWHPSGVAISDMSQAHVRIDIRGPGTGALLSTGSPSLALDPAPRAAMVGFAGVPLLVQQLADGVRLHVEHSLAPHLWHWLCAACHNAKDHP